MALLDELLDANRHHAAQRSRPPEDAPPLRHLAVVTCMDVRVDPLGAFGLRLGEAHVLRNAGGRVTDDVLRSLVLSTRVLGVDAVVVMEHTRCGLSGTTDGELRAGTGVDLPFLAIEDHREALRHDVDLLRGTPYLSLREVAGLLYDVDTGLAEVVVRHAGA